ncbi:hypothetical protein BJ875DRAFT_511220 [Amylocarpus encephaloides]|uniref:NB-ARC domain-containing protein n=1 Tax=Amylocarpus encephaloides TaxID=45428 RepID=A0A9P7YHV2_9HELO|nr:hypothetical protein BJ875DRAFT_511220 [Amylocarpus encephaloides]
MAEQALHEHLPDGPQFSEAVASFLCETLSDATKSLAVRIKNSPDTENEGDTPPSSEREFDESQPLFNVPYARNPNFGGRSASLKQLFEMWKPRSKGRIAIVGLGGIGKTELMVEFTYRLREVSPDVPIFWFRSIDLLSSPEASSTSSSSATGMQMDKWLETERSSKSLLVVDPGESFQCITQHYGDDHLLDKLRLYHGSCIILTRDAQSGRSFAGPHGLCELGDLDLDICTTLLHCRLGPLAQGSSSEIEEVAQSMSCLPGAILQTARLITATGMTVAQFLELYNSSDSMKFRLFGKLDRFSSPDPKFSVIGKGVVDVRAFRKEFPKASRILYQIYFLGGKSVPVNLFFATEDLDMVIFLFILKGHLLLVNDSMHQSHTIHPLVYLAMGALLEGPRTEAEDDHIKEELEWFVEIVTTFSEWYPDADNEDRTWWRNCFTHLLGGCDLQINSLRVEIAKIHRKEAAYFKQRGRYTDALRMTLLAKNVLSVAPSSDHLSILQDQITLLDLLGRYRDVQKALQDYPKDDEEQMVLWKKRMQARLEQADGAARYESATQILHHVRSARETGCHSRVDLLQSIDDYGWILMLKGRVLDASNECRRALAGRTSSFGMSHTDTLASFHHLASILRLEGRYEEGLHYAQEAIRGRENILGPNHPDTLHSKIFKAQILNATAVMLSDFDEAETLLVDSSNRLSSILSESHPIIMASRSDRALVMLGRGKYEAAEQMNSATLSSRQGGPWMEAATHPDTLTSKHQLAEILWRKEGCLAADALSDEVFIDRTEILTKGTIAGDDFHPDQLTSLQLRAIVLSGLGEHLAALQKIDIALEGRRTLLGPNHPDVYMSMTWKGEIMRSQLPADPDKRAHILEEIESLHRQALDGLTFTYGSQHQSTLQAMTHLALAKAERGPPGHSEAVTLHHILFRAYLHSLSDLHPETLKAKSRLATAMRTMSPKFQSEAKTLWREACGGFAKSLGVDAYLTLMAYKGYEKFLRGFPDQ